MLAFIQILEQDTSAPSDNRVRFLTHVCECFAKGTFVSYLACRQFFVTKSIQHDPFLSAQALYDSFCFQLSNHIPGCISINVHISGDIQNRENCFPLINVIQQNTGAGCESFAWAFREEQDFLFDNGKVYGCFITSFR